MLLLVCSCCGVFYFCGKLLMYVPAVCVVFVPIGVLHMLSHFTNN